MMQVIRVRQGQDRIMKRIITERKQVLCALAAAALLTAAAVSGVLDRADQTVSDAWYQKPSASNGDIVLVGIDQKALEDIGPFQNWGRDTMAMVIEALNASEDCHPAVIAIDVLYAGETTPEKDAWLSEAAGQYQNVVTACAAEFGTKFQIWEDGSTTMDDFAVIAFDEAYLELKEKTSQGHINAMLDGDGILRHSLWSITTPEGVEIPSMAAVAAAKYLAYQSGEKAEHANLETVTRYIKKPPTDARGFWYLPFTGLPGDYSESISVADILSGDVPADYFADRIVLIGPYAAGLQDSYPTAIDHAQQMYGVEYQANVIEALLAGNYKQEAADGWQYLLLFLITGAFGLWIWKRKMLPATFGCLLLSGGWILLSRLAYERGIVLHLLWIPLGIIVIYVLGIAINYITEALEKHRVTSTFKKYVAPQIVQEILDTKNPEALMVGGRVVNIAVLFVDIRGFTTMSEKLSPSEVVEILNQYLSLIADCIMRNGGTLDKFIGDAAMAFWGAPLPQEDYVMKAVRAAEDMRQGSDELSKVLMEKYGRTVSFGIGVHVGDAVVGNIGSPQRMDYTAIGDTVNTSSRLEANAPARTIFISREVADRLKGRIKVTSLGTSIKLKGKSDMEILTMDEILE